MEASQFKECLDTFCVWSGQSFNSHKSNIFFNRNTNRDLEGLISGILQFERIPILSHYLGLPLFCSNKISDFSYVVDKLDSKLAGWKSRLLSKASRFDRSGALCLCAWDTIYAPKGFGGLGFRWSSDMNRDFLAKWCWSLVSNAYSLRFSILRGKYLRNNSFLNVAASPTDSIFWKHLVKTKPLILRGVCIMVGNGSLIDLWLHLWVPSHPTFRLISVCLRDHGALVVADLFHPNRG
ncbi:hypothetical protein UlMin_036586 [Ulmus minor]